MLLFRRRDKSEAFLSAELRDLGPVDVNFGNCLRLAGARVSCDDAGVTLKLRWRTLERAPRALRCFAHVLAGDRQISSLDHDILRHGPSIASWEAGDEGYESLRLWLRNPPEDVEIRLGVYDPEINVRAPVLVSTLPLADDGSAVTLRPGVTPELSYVVKFQTVPLTPCRVVFEGGLHLSSYSLARRNELVWLRLKWIVSRGRRRAVRFFGHLVAEAAPESPTLLQFDQDFIADRRGPVTAVEQNIVGAVQSRAAAGGTLRAGVFDPATSYRLKIEGSTLPFDDRHRCVYLPFLEPQISLVPGTVVLRRDLALLEPR